MNPLRFLRSLRAIAVRFASLVVVATLALVATPSHARAQKALVYCPVGIDVAGCTNLVAALQPVFPSGVDRGYDGSGGTVDLRTADLWRYSVIAIPSLATTGGATPYAVLSDTALGSRLHDAVLGRVALWSGTPDLGSPNGTQKDTLIQNLGKWAAASYGAVKGAGLVVFQDMSDSIATQYGWLHVIVGTAIQGDSTVGTYASVQGTTPTGTALLKDPSGTAIAYANMAAFGFLAPGAGSGFTVDGVAMSAAGTQNVLLTSLGGNTGTATIITDAADYPPGSVVTITGAGFAPGEAVTITFRERPYFDTPSTITTAADKSGGFVDTSFSPDSADLGVRFIATATGKASGVRAVTTFSDDIGINNNAISGGAQSPASLTAGGSATFLVNVAFKGNGGSCTVGLSVTSGLPSGATASFSPATLTNNTNTTLTSTLTIATTSATPVGASTVTIKALGTGTPLSNTCTPANAASTNTVSLSVSAPASVAGNTSIGSSASTSVFGQSVTFTATVSPASGSTAPTGTIQFLDNGSNLGSPVALSGGVATVSTAALGAGSHTISATYSPGSGFSAGTVSSTTQTVNKATPSITWGTPTAINYGTALSAAQLNATASPGAGTFTYTPASGALLAAGAQTLSVVFTPTDGADYNTASSSVLLTVNKLSASVTANDQTRAFGLPDPTLTGTLTGFLPADNITATYATTATTTSDVGTYPITASLVDPNGRLGNYTVTPTGGTFTITQATQSISFTAPSGVHYGDADVALGATATSGGAVSYVSSTPAVCTIVASSVHVVGVGNCSITAQQSGTTNYSGAADVTRAFSIAQRAIGVTANALGKTYGALEPTLTYAVSSGSLVGSDAFTGALSRAPGENAGAYAIGQGTLTAGPNYALSFTGATFTINKADQTISFTQPADPTFGDAPLQLAATASSSLAVSFAATGSCSLAQTNVLTILGAGSCVVTASQGGDGNHNAAPDVAYTLSVKKATPAVTAQGGTFTYDGLTHAATTGATGVGGAALTPLTVTYNGGSTLPKNAGSYAVVVSYAGSTDYLAGSANATITIDQKPLTVTADDKSKVYGAATPAFTASYAGFVNNEGPSDLTGMVSFGGTAASAVDAGTYVIAPSGVSSQNYAITFSNGTLSIAKAPLSVQAANASREYGDPNPAFTGTLAGVVNNDNITAAYSSTATAGSPVGTLPITATITDPNGRLTNYAVTNTDGTLTITAAPLTVTSANANRPYGATNPAFTGNVVGLKNNDPITAAYGTTATASSGVGNYDITATLADPSSRLGNYAVTLNKGVLNITPAPLTVTADAATKVYGSPNPSFTVHYTGFVLGEGAGALGGALGFATSATPASAVGGYPVTPSGLTSSNYAITFADGTLTVTPAPLGVKADDVSRLYGDGNPTFTGSVTGIQNNDAITATYASAADPTSDVGSYAIVPTLVDGGNKLANYTVTATNGALTITKAPLTIAAAGATRLYGAANPSFTGTITGIRNNDGITATYSTTATPQDNVGSYAIVPAAVDGAPSKLGNYAVTLTNGSLVVTPAPLSVAANASTKVYGGINPTFSVTYAGFVNNETAAVLGGTLAFATSADLATGVGTVPVTPSGLTSTNYSITFSAGQLTITQAPLTIAAANASRLYGAANPTFTGTITGIRNGDAITATYGTTAAAATDVGTYPIVPAAVDANPAKLQNYAVTLTNASLTINPAPLSVTPANVSVIRGDQLPSLTGAVTGIMNNDPISVAYTAAAITNPYVNSPPGSYNITASLLDPAHKLGDYTVTLNVGTLTVLSNALPVLGPVSAPTAPVQIGTSVTASASFTDADVSASNPYVTAINWGDGQTTTGSLGTPGSISGAHSYGSAGVYTVTISVADKINTAPIAQSFEYVVIYDPSAGFVTGGGWINSPAAACQLSSACAGATGKATFGFNARYQRGANTPDGSTEFQFQAGGLNFKSTTYQWLVVAGSKAQYKGVGSINGKGTYNFMLTAIDGDLQNGKADAFRIKITDPSTGNVVYDNQMGSDDTSNSATVLGGGSIVIHQ